MEDDLSFSNTPVLVCALILDFIASLLNAFPDSYLASMSS